MHYVILGSVVDLWSSNPTFFMKNIVIEKFSPTQITKLKLITDMSINNKAIPQ